MSNTDINTTSIMLYTAKTGSSTFIWISNAGDLIGGPVGRTTSPIGLVGESLDATIKGTEAYNSNDPWREFFSYAGGVFGTGVGIALIPTTSGAGLIIGGAIGSPLGPEGTFIGGIIGGVIFGATGVYIAEELGSKAMEELYDHLMGLPPSDNLTDAQRAELAAMLTAGGMPWDYNPNGEEANPSDFLGDIGKELGKLLDMLPDDLVPDFLDGLLGGLDDIFPNGILPWLFDLFPYELDPDIYQPFLDALGWHRPVDPLILDLDGDGVETIGISETNHTMFDSDGDGVKTATGWVGKDDGLLVLDRNGNGTIDNGSELFGDQTMVNGTKAKDGFSALSSEDTNKDGKFDANDTNFSNVRVWRDMDSDGVSDDGELFTLNELGIASINISSSSESTTNNTNTITATSTFTKADGTTGAVANLNFTSNNFYSEFTDEIELDSTAISLPSMGGSGMVRDIQEASTLSEGLTYTVQTLQSQGYVTKDKFMGQLDDMISNWADTSDMQTSVELARSILGKELVYLPNLSLDDLRLYIFGITLSSGSSDMHSDNTVTITFATAEEESQFEKMEHIREEAERLTKLIEILERFNGHNFVDIKPEESKPVSFGDTKILDGATITRTTTAASDGGSSSGSGYILPEIPMIVMLDASQIANLEKSYETLKESMYNGFALQSRLKSYMNAIELTLDENGFGLDMSGVVDKLNMLALNNLKNALIDWDELMHFGGAKFDVIDDNATLSLHEWVSKIANNPEMMNELQALNGLELADGVLVAGSNDVDNIDTGYVSGTHVVFSGNGDDNVIIRAYDATIYAGSGNDTITTGGGNDTIYGGDDNDVISTNSGDDVIIGGKGDDILNGSYGSDTYIFNRGDGKDIIREYDHWVRGTDVLIFGEGISRDDIVAKVDGDNLILAIREDGKTFDELSDKITIEKWYKDFYSVEEIRFDDGTKLTTFNDIISLLSTNGDDIIKGYNSQNNIINAEDGNDTISIASNLLNTIHGGNGDDTINSSLGTNTIYGDNGNDTITMGGGNDTIYGGDDNDVISTNSGDDVIIGGKGDDILNGSYGSDTYIFNRGDGKDIIREYDHWVRGTDVLIFGEGISRDDIVAKVDGDNLILAIREDGKTFDELSDKITIEKWYKDFYSIEEIQFDDGTKLTMFNDIISLLSTNGDDIIKGYNSQNNIINAEDGNDTISIASNLLNTIHGGNGDDTINSSLGTNTIYGDNGNDTITTGSGNDTIYGGDGNDTITTGSGADVVVLNSLVGYDSVLDFSISQDKFQLDGNIFESLVDLQGVLSVDNISFGANTTVANDENDFIIYNQTNGNIFYDADGSGSVYAAILIADVTNNLVLNNTHFVVM